MLINKRQLCMMLTAGWSGPRHNPPLLLLTFQRPGAYPRRCAQSSLSRSSSVQDSGGGRPWPSLPYQPSYKHTHKARTPCRYCMRRPTDGPSGSDALTLSNTHPRTFVTTCSFLPSSPRPTIDTLEGKNSRKPTKVFLWLRILTLDLLLSSILCHYKLKCADKTCSLEDVVAAWKTLKHFFTVF